MLRGDHNQVPFELWEKRLWSCHDIKTAIKIKVYNEVVLSSPLYSTETTILHRGYFRKPTKTQLQHLRQILRIKWEEDVPDAKELKRARIFSAEFLITSSGLRWIGHVKLEECLMTVVRLMSMES